MSNNMFKTVADVATTTAATTTLWAWINENSGAIMAIASVISLLVATVFYILSHIDKRKQTRAQVNAVILDALREGRERGVDNTPQFKRLLKRIDG